MTEQKRTQHVTKPINRWKVAFITLCCLLVGCFAAVGYVAFKPLPHTPKVETVSTSGKAKVELSLTKEQSNKILSYYLNQALSNDNVKLRFSLEDQALITGKFKFLNVPMTFYLYLDPVVMENGNIKLKATSLSIGNLRLPISLVLKYIDKSMKLPRWIVIDPDEKVIDLNFTKLSIDKGITIRTKDIDLLNDELRFDIYLPTES